MNNKNLNNFLNDENTFKGWELIGETQFNLQKLDEEDYNKDLDAIILRKTVEPDETFVWYAGEG